MSRRVLVVEDQADIAELVALHLKDLGLEVEIAYNGNDGLMQAKDPNFSLVILDVMLPGMDGLAVIRQMRMDRVNTPVLMLTARSTEIDRVLGLELGADDYLTKPFSIPELQARVKALLRRSDLQSNIAKIEAPISSEAIEIKGLKINTESHQVTLDGEGIPLTSKEFDLLMHFARAPGRVFTRNQLLEAVWGTSYEGYEHNVNTHINRLRSKLEKDPTNPQYVLTVRGVGYRMATHE
jgi:DNA-binding response OmpR family regulator